jgi:aconitate hydratase
VGQVVAGAGLQNRALYLEEAGLTTELEQLGFGVVAFACTTCNGMSGALDPVIQQEIIDRDLYATAVLSGNRNFDGRIHPYAKQALASPPLVVAYAIAGTIRFDIEKDVLGVVDGKEIRLKDIWPSDEEIDAVVKASVKPEQFRRSTSRCSPSTKTPVRKSPLYDWREMSTYIRRPPYWEGALAGERTPAACARWRCCRTTSPPTTCRRPTRSCSTAPPANTWRKWACRKRTSTPTPPTVATT